MNCCNSYVYATISKLTKSLVILIKNTISSTAKKAVNATEIVKILRSKVKTNMNKHNSIKYPIHVDKKYKCICFNFLYT